MPNSKPPSRKIGERISDSTKRLKKSNFLLLGLFSAWFLIIALALSGQIMAAGMSNMSLILGAVCVLAIAILIITICPKAMLFFAGALAALFSSIDALISLNVLAAMVYLLMAYALYSLGLYFLE